MPKTQEFKAVVNLRGYTVRKINDKIEKVKGAIKTKRGVFARDYDLAVHAQFNSPLNVNAIRRTGRALHVLESADVNIQSSKGLAKFTIKVTKAYLTTSYKGNSVRVPRTKTIIPSRAMIDIGVDVHKLITYLISDKVIDLSIPRAKRTKQPKDRKHASMMTKAEKLAQQLAELNADIKEYNPDDQSSDQSASTSASDQATSKASAS